MGMQVPEIAYGIGALVLLAVLAWATWQYRNRNRANDRVTERATRELYQHPKSYNERKFEKDLKGS
jgi:hypothetical protein